jgi:hypothetical protein
MLTIHSMALAMPRLSRRHPNRLPFRGVLTLVDIPSDRAPSGARGHRVLLTRDAAERALPSLLGMALDYTPALDGHDARRKIGIITEADIAQRSQPGDGARPVSGAELRVSGYIFARDFPDFVDEISGKQSSVDSRSSLAGCAEFTRHGERPTTTDQRLLGMSYEIADARVKSLSASIWVLTDVVFTGAAVLRRDKAAYQDTWITLDSK